MKKYISTIFFLAFSVCAFSQSVQNIPGWVQMMHQQNVDIGALHDAYEKYYSENPFEKNSWTQEYKRLMMLHSRDNNGSTLGLPPDENKFSEQQYLERCRSMKSLRTPTSVWECIGQIGRAHV